MFQARECRTRRCSISAPRVTLLWTDARRTEPAGKLRRFIHDCVLKISRAGISGSVSKLQVDWNTKYQNICIGKLRFFPGILFDWNSPRIEQSNCCWPNSFLFERERERWEEGDAERAEPKFIYLFSFSDHIWSLSRADVWIAAVETDVWPPWGNFIEKFQNNTASTLPFVFASKHFIFLSKNTYLTSWIVVGLS